MVIDQLEPILDLMSSWKKLEFGSWPALLDEVQDQYEINAAKVNQHYQYHNILHRTKKKSFHPTTFKVVALWPLAISLHPDLATENNTQ
nr:hypothetical protein CFP56_63180 [Quercus suber]